jgi:hypothetical protein
MEMVHIPNLAKRIKATARECLRSDYDEGTEDWHHEYDAETYASYRKFLHKEWPGIRRGEIDADYAHWLNDLIADQGSSLAFCVKHRDRRRRRRA